MFAVELAHGRCGLLNVRLILVPVSGNRPAYRADGPDLLAEELMLVVHINSFLVVPLYVGISVRDGMSCGFFLLCDLLKVFIKHLF